MFEAAGATFNDETGYYEMNGYTDMDEKEIFDTYSKTYGLTTKDLINPAIRISYPAIRTNFPLISSDGASGSEVTIDWFVKTLRLTSKYQTFSCQKLHLARNTIEKVYDYVTLWGTSGNLFSANTPNLTDLVLVIGSRNGTGQSLNFSNCPLLNYRSFYETIRRTSGNEASGQVSILVHPTTYGYLTGTIEPTEQVGGTKEEWMQIVTDAQAKQISFATTE